MAAPIPVIDLFAGPGGLNEGFSRLGEEWGRPEFETVGSFEMESSAVQTLTLRGVYRVLLRQGRIPAEYYDFIRGVIPMEAFKAGEGVAEAFQVSAAHVHQVELGGPNDDSHDRISHALTAAGVINGSRPWALIGGPPCQAYSLAGRSRRANDATFADDKKHFLYREYLKIIRTFEPPVFVMENVKGLLSSTTAGRSMFDLIREDLGAPKPGLSYTLYSVVTGEEPRDPRDFVIRAEDFGVPQKRHRVIVLGVRKGYLPEGAAIGTLTSVKQVTVEEAIHGLPRLRSGVSPHSADGDENWLAIRRNAQAEYGGARLPKSGDGSLTRGGPASPRTGTPTSEIFARWVIDPNLTDAIQHQARSHMPSDLERYWFASNAARGGASPRLSEFPPALQPAHKNATSDSRPFEDRFRVQVADKPSTTVVSHISKDGHYYIHPDPLQMRSLTVREAARLQSFPDNYFFVGNRTQQYHQVGNAVPPLLANQIARIVAQIFRDVSHESD